jgi:hypothetical protein
MAKVTTEPSARIKETVRMPPARLYFQPVGSISPEFLGEAWAFIDRFVVWSRRGFETAVRGYSEALIYRCSENRTIVGLAFLKEVRVIIEGRPTLLLVTALTVIDERFRGQNLIQRAGLRCFVRARLKNPTVPIYWLFMARSYKSYLLLSRNFRYYWPRPDHGCPPHEKALLDAAAQVTYGDLWDGERGVVSLPDPCPWRPGVLDLTPEALEDPDVRYFVERAPGWQDAESLGCLCPLTLRNWAWVVGRLVARTRRHRKRG